MTPLFVLSALSSSLVVCAAFSALASFAGRRWNRRGVAVTWIAATAIATLVGVLRVGSYQEQAGFITPTPTAELVARLMPSFALALGASSLYVLRAHGAQQVASTLKVSAIGSIAGMLGLALSVILIALLDVAGILR